MDDKKMPSAAACLDYAGQTYRRMREAERDWEDEHAEVERLERKAAELEKWAKAMWRFIGRAGMRMRYMNDCSSGVLFDDTRQGNTSEHC